MKNCTNACMLACVLLPGTLLAQTTTVVVVPIDQRVADLERATTALRAENKTLRSRLANQSKRINAVQSLAQTHQTELSGIRSDIDILNKKYAWHDNRLDEHAVKLERHDARILETELQLARFRSQLEGLENKVKRLEEINPVSAKDFAALLVSFQAQERKILTMDIDHDREIKALCVRIKRINAKADFAIARPAIVREVFVDRPVPAIPVVSGYFGYVPRCVYRYPAYTTLGYCPW